VRDGFKASPRVVWQCAPTDIVNHLLGEACPTMLSHTGISTSTNSGAPCLLSVVSLKEVRPQPIGSIGAKDAFLLLRCRFGLEFC
jgi:hypothetical protein